MFFQPGTQPRTDSRIAHLGLTVPRRSRFTEVLGAIALGATRKLDVLEVAEHVQWTILADPEGHFVCIAEHAPVEEYSNIFLAGYLA